METQQYNPLDNLDALKHRLQNTKPDRAELLKLITALTDAAKNDPADTNITGTRKLALQIAGTLLGSELYNENHSGAEELDKKIEALRAEISATLFDEILEADPTNSGLRIAIAVTKANTISWSKAGLFSLPEGC